MTVRPSATETEPEHEPPREAVGEPDPPPDLHRLIEWAGTRPLLAAPAAEASGEKPALEARRQALRALRHFHHAGEAPAGSVFATGTYLPASLVAWLQGNETAIPETPAHPLEVFLGIARETVLERRKAFAESTLKLRRDLRAMLDADRMKTETSRGADALGKQLGGVSSAYLDSAALSAALGPHRGARALTPERRERIESLVEALGNPAFREDEPLVTILHDGPLPGRDTFAAADIVLEKAADPCAEAARRFDRRAAEFAIHARAARIARLELAGTYDPERHGPWFAHFDWESFSREELLLVPLFLAVDSAEGLAHHDMASLSHLLLSGRPVQVAVFVPPMANPAALAGQEPRRDTGAFRLELGTLALGHREAFVHHASPGAPERLEIGFRAALGCARAALHLLPAGGAWLLQRAALEARAHPVFVYDPERGETWARRMDFAGNPQPESDWPRYRLACRRDAGGAEGVEELDVAVTLADMALLDPEFRDAFAVIPAELAEEEFVPVDAWLALEGDEATRRLPFLWGVDGDGTMRRLVPTRRLLAACNDRRHTWRTLQELAGVRSEYVERAVDAVREKTLAEARAQREELEAAHREEIDRVRREAAGEAMQRLARSLLDLDPDALATGLTTRGGTTAAPAAPAATPTNTEAAAGSGAAPAGAAPTPSSRAAASVEEEEEIVSEEPWIDSELCTSCNDCTNINPRLFVYNGNKQAEIGDPRAGTYAQLVAAAEKCPAHCIHPGKPLDPNEPGLDDLVTRAAKFN